MNTENIIRDVDEYDWEYIRGQKDMENVIRWKTLVGGKDSNTIRKDITFGVFEIPPGQLLEPHHHFPAEVYFVYEGRGDLLLNETIQQISPGSVVYIASDEVHGIRNSYEETLKLYWMFPTDNLKDIEYHMDDRNI